jgi:RNA polymerase sigma-70 factor (ECF subfamily)
LRFVLDVQALYEKYGPMVLRRCRYLLRNEERALDALQDTFVQVLRHEKRLKLDAPSSLLYRIATNICLNMLRHERRHPQTSDEALLTAIADPEGHEAGILNRHLIDRIFRRELPSTRTMAVMHYVDGMTLQEVAGQMGLSVSGVRKRLRKLRERARNLHEDRYDDR